MYDYDKRKSANGKFIEVAKISEMPRSPRRIVTVDEDLDEVPDEE
jgi:hypothetical protein